MQAKTEIAPRPLAGLIQRSVLWRELLRAVLAFGLYLALNPLWNLIGGHAAYERLILKIAESVIRATQHFPIISSLESLSVSNLDFLVLFAFSYFVVSQRIPWKARLWRFGTMFLLILIFHSLAVATESNIDTTLRLAADEGLMLLLPWQLLILDGFKYLLVELGFQIGPFLVMLLAAAWNAGLGVTPAEADKVEAGPRKRKAYPAPRVSLVTILRRRATVAILVALVAGATTVLAWSIFRESDPRHIQTHVLVGDLFLDAGQLEIARAQFQAAIRKGSTDGRAWYYLALIAYREGNPDESRRFLKEGLRVVDNPEWRSRMQESLSGRRERD